MGKKARLGAQEVIKSHFAEDWQHLAIFDISFFSPKKGNKTGPKWSRLVFPGTTWELDARQQFRKFSSKVELTVQHFSHLGKSQSLRDKSHTFRSRSPDDWPPLPRVGTRISVSDLDWEPSGIVRPARKPSSCPCRAPAWYWPPNWSRSRRIPPNWECAVRFPSLDAIIVFKNFRDPRRGKCSKSYCRN